MVTSISDPMIQNFIPLMLAQAPPIRIGRNFSATLDEMVLGRVTRYEL